MVRTVNVMNYRFYNIKNQWLPSVTSILSIKHNPALSSWKKVHTPEQVQLISEYTSERGEIIHYASLKAYHTDTIKQDPFPKEKLHYYRLYPKMKDEIRLAYQQFLEFKQQYHLTSVALEKVVWNDKYQFAGRVDFLGYLHNGNTGSKIPIVMDIKTSKAIYTESLSLQLGAYNLCIKKKARQCYVLLLHPGRTVLDGVVIGRDKPYWSFKEIIPDYTGFLKLIRAFEPLKELLLERMQEQELMT